MKDKVNKLKEDFCKAKNNKERKAIDDEIQKLIMENPDMFAEAMANSAAETAERATALSIRQKMEDILPATSIAYIAKKYFDKTDSWLFQRINGNVVNGRPATFTNEELEKLKFAFRDLSERFGSLSVSL